jgi:hypothetical protein
VFAAEHALTLGAESDLLRAVGQQTVALLERTGATTPWTGYLAVDRTREIIIGTCAFRRILEKLGFERIGEVMDPEAGPVWRWDRPRHGGER